MTVTFTPKDIVHPADETALKALNAIPGFKMIAEKALENIFERQILVENMSNYIRLNDKQLPEIYGLLPPICKTLDIPVPDLFLSSDPWPNAYTVGNTRCCVVLTSGLLEILEFDEIASVLAHECGHIYHKHCLYHTIGHYLGSGIMSWLAWIPGVTDAVALSLNTWRRMSELSADRVEALVMGTPKKPIAVLSKLAGGIGWLSPRYSINNEEIQQQVRDFHDLSQHADLKGWENLSAAFRSHPFYIRRIQELSTWCRTPVFSRYCRELGIIVCQHCETLLKSDDRFCPNAECARPQ